MDKLSILILTPNFAASSISLNDTPFGVKIICSGEKPAANPSCTS